MLSGMSTHAEAEWVPDIGFGDRLRVVRRRKRRRQAEMAQLLDVKKVTYASWEAGSSTPAHADVVSIARRLQLLDRVPVIWTLGAYVEAPYPGGPEGGDVLGNREAGHPTITDR